jgi:hypothetical protein
MTQVRGVRSRDEFLETVRARARELKATRPQIDHVAGFTPGYAGKLLGPAQIKTAVNDSAFSLLWSLGLQIVIAEDPAALEAVRPHYRRIRPYGCNQHESKLQETS